MPYRRLPNTDQARVRALRAAIEAEEKHVDFENIISFNLLYKAKVTLEQFEKKLSLYQQALNSQVEANKTYQHHLKNTRLYISHFIQVLNFAVIRNEIKKEHKTFYHLDPDDFTVPELSTESALLKWGENLISGEEERIRNGGTAMYNPGIARVKVHFDKFKSNKEYQKTFQRNTNRYLAEVASLREGTDKLILEIWNEIEEKFTNLAPFKKMTVCKNYGIIYYYRKGEAEITPEDDEKFIRRQEAMKAQLSIF